jgi:uncharacterized membrane protein YgdD (TMEM256/DUF423 family)
MAVLLGAFGAHLLPRFLATQELSVVDISRRLANWETASRYLMYHALALLTVGLLAERRSHTSLRLAGWAMLAGTLIFCGCLYLLVLTGITALGRIVPIGGVLMIVGWALLAYAASSTTVDGSRQR